MLFLGVILNCLLSAICASDPVFIQENNHDHEKPSNILGMNEKGPEDVTLTKLLSIQLNGGYEHIHPDLQEVIRSQFNPDFQKNIANQIQSLSKAEPRIHQTSEKPPGVENLLRGGIVQNDLSNKTVHCQNVEGLLTKVYFDSLIKELKNIIISQSSVYLDFTENCKSLVGVDENHFCKPYKKTNRTIPKDCKEIMQNGQNVSGIYEIQPKMSQKPFMALCDMETMGGGWTHIQRRIDGSQDFNLGWREYKFGFGNLNGEFWLGLENMHILTDYDAKELLIEIVDRDGVKVHAQYRFFAIGSEKEGYPLKTLSYYSGDAGDSLTHHLGAKFSTKDYDQDTDGNSCAVKWNAAWWFKSCFKSSLNGKFVNVDLPEANKLQGVHWDSFRGVKYCHSKARMLIRSY